MKNGIWKNHHSKQYCPKYSFKIKIDKNDWYQCLDNSNPLVSDWYWQTYTIPQSLKEKKLGLIDTVYLSLQFFIFLFVNLFAIWLICPLYSFGMFASGFSLQILFHPKTSIVYYIHVSLHVPTYICIRNVQELILFDNRLFK